MRCASTAETRFKGADLIPKKIKILSTGTSFPERIVTAEELDKKLGLPAGWVLSKSGALVRRHVTYETSSQMGAEAALVAMKKANIEIDDIDYIICASRTAEQEIPCTAALIQKRLGPNAQGISAFDVNSTCLSFVVALDIVSGLLCNRQSGKALIISTEASSSAINWNEKESAVLIGDGAAAVILEYDLNAKSEFLSSRLETYSQFSDLVDFKGGGTKIMTDPDGNIRSEH